MFGAWKLEQSPEKRSQRCNKNDGQDPTHPPGNRRLSWFYRNREDAQMSRKRMFPQNDPEQRQPENQDQKNDKADVSGHEEVGKHDFAFILLPYNPLEQRQSWFTHTILSRAKLTGDLKGHWSVSVTGNWRIIFTFEDGEFHNLELIDYH